MVELYGAEYGSFGSTVLFYVFLNEILGVVTTRRDCTARAIWHLACSVRVGGSRARAGPSSFIHTARPPAYYGHTGKDTIHTKTKVLCLHLSGTLVSCLVGWAASASASSLVVKTDVASWR